MALVITPISVTDSSAFHGTGPLNIAGVPFNSSALVCIAVTGTSQTDGSVTAALTVADSGGGVWTQRVIGQSLTGGNDFAAWYTRPTGSSVTVTVTIDCSNTDIYRYLVHIFDLTGYSTSTPIGATGQVGPTTGGTPFAYPLSGIPSSQSYVLAVGHVDGGGGLAYSSATWTLGFDQAPDVESVSEYRTASVSSQVNWADLTDAGGEACSAAIEVLVGSTVAADSFFALGSPGQYGQMRRITLVSY